LQMFGQDTELSVTKSLNVFFKTLWAPGVARGVGGQSFGIAAK